MPEPLGWLVAILGAAPFERLQNYKSDTYAAALQHVVTVAWPMIVIVLAVAFAATAIAVQWQRKYFRSNTGIWAAFVFLFGIPGLIAYWLEHRSVKLDGCQECGHVVPRDRDACAACSTPFPAPTHVETEIFA
jgi:heme/copper-type cytochrome/quinol oxidase subunit 2